MAESCISAAIQPIVYSVIFYIYYFFRLDWYLLSLYHHHAVILGLGGPMVKVVKLQHNTDEELIK